jgi:hypothetical protein
MVTVLEAILYEYYTIYVSVKVSEGRTEAEHEDRE